MDALLRLEVACRFINDEDFEVLPSKEKGGQIHGSIQNIADLGFNDGVMLLDDNEYRAQWGRPDPTQV